MKTPTTTVASLSPAGSPAMAMTTVGQSRTEAAPLFAGAHALRLETAQSFSLVFGTLIVALVVIRHFVARARSGPIQHLL